MTNFSRKMMAAVLGLGLIVAVATSDATAGGRRFSFGSRRGGGISFGNRHSNNSNNNYGNLIGNNGGFQFGGGSLSKKSSSYNQHGFNWGFHSNKKFGNHFNGYVGSHGNWGFGYGNYHKGFGFSYVSHGQSYYNPYCATPIYGYDYTAPIAPNVGPPGGNILGFEACREAFLRGDYARAEQAINASVQRDPQNPELHQLRSLVMFAKGNFQQAAAIAHSALTSSAGWDWNRVRSFYPSAAQYTQQLRRLENAVDAQPKTPELRFLLGYHYLMLGHTEAARKQLSIVIELEPRDEVAKQLMNMGGKPAPGKVSGTDELEELDEADGAVQPVQNPPVQNPPVQNPPVQDVPVQDVPVQQTTPEQPVPQQPTFLGTWKARPASGVEVTFVLQANGSFVWKIDRNGKSSQFIGKATLAGSSLKLIRNETNEALEGTISSINANSFRIKLKDQNGQSPELTFTR